ncbi:protein-tyrosine phosphatase-like protein [Umbelopsis sp. AD052]|nr:protein-tyrosine phosphatase-like protein [Umbelopsis sp. AD052]
MYSIIQDRYLIIDCPTEATLPKYLDIFKQQNVTHVVRICDAANTYDAQKLESEGITVHDEIKFQDGGVPDQPAVDKWLQLTNESRDIIGVHCVSGIGRAPVLVTISLIENGMDPLDAIAHVRKYRRGALNKRQIHYIDHYKRRSKRSGFLRSLFR